MIRLSEAERLALHWAIVILPFAIALVTILLLAQVIQPFFFIIAIFFLAWLLAFMLDPIVNAIRARLPILPRGLTAALVFLLVMLGLVLLLVTVASSVIASLVGILGDTQSVDGAVARLVQPLQEQITGWGIQFDLTSSVDEAINVLERSGSDLLDDILNGGIILFTQGTAIIFIAVVMVANKGRFLRFGQRLMPPGQEELWDEVAEATSRSFGGFIRGQFGLAALYGLVVGAIAWLFGVPFVALVALVTAALQSIPYFGQLVSWAPLFVTTLVFAPEALLPVTVVLVIGLLVIQNVVSPRVLGTAVGLNPILVLAAVFVGAQVAGALGGVFGVPVAAVGATLFNAWLDSVRPPAAIDVSGEADERAPAKHDDEEGDTTPVTATTTPTADQR